MKSKIHSLLWTESRSKAGKKDEANHIQKSQELPIFLKSSQFVLISILIFNGCHFMTLDDLRSKTIQPAEVFGSLQNAELDMESLESRYGWWHDTTRHEFFQSGRCWMTWNVGRPYASGSMAEAGWTDEIQGFKLSAVMRIRRILYCVLISMDSSWIFFWIVLDTWAATSITTVSCTSCICHPSAPIPTFASPYLIIFVAMSSCTLQIPTGLFRANARRHWSGCKMHEAGKRWLGKWLFFKWVGSTTNQRMSQKNVQPALIGSILVILHPGLG